MEQWKFKKNNNYRELIFDNCRNCKHIKIRSQPYEIDTLTCKKFVGKKALMKNNIETFQYTTEFYTFDNYICDLHKRNKNK